MWRHVQRSCNVFEQTFRAVRVEINSSFGVANRVPDSISTNALTLFRDFQSETTGKACAFH